MDTRLEKTHEVSHTRMAGDERRLQILNVAVEVFSKRGYSGATTREIAQAAGVSEAIIFRHFANKEELYSAILDMKACTPMILRPFSEIEEFVAKKDDFNVFYTIAINALRHHDGDCDFMRLMLHSALEGHGLAQAFFDRFVIQVYEHLGDYIRQRQQDGDFREMNPKIAVRALIGMFVHHSLNNILWDKERRILDISNEDAAREFATILLQGIRNQGNEATS